MDPRRCRRQRGRHRDDPGSGLTDSAVALSARRLNRATLDRQLLLAREPLSIADAARRIVAIQAQEPASPYVALWNRVAPFDPADVDAAFREQRVVKATLMRMTLHAVHADDYAPFHDAMLAMLIGARLDDPRFTIGGVASKDALALQAVLLDFASEARSAAEIEAMLATHITDPKRLWWALRSFAPLIHAPDGGPWSFSPTRRAFVAAPAGRAALPPRAALGTLVRRYLEGFGPASIPDIAQFTRLSRGLIREALADAGPLVELAGPGRPTLYDTPDGRPIPAEDQPAPPRLLPMWDSVLLAYDERSRILPDDLRPLVIRTNGDVLPTVLVDGYVAGIWRPLEHGLEVTAYRPIAAGDWDALGREAADLLGWLRPRDPKAYARHRRWWTRLPEPLEVRRLADD